MFKKFEDITRKTYNKVSKKWDSKRQFSWKPVSEFLKSFENKENLKLLDVGCGAGRDLSEAMKQGFKQENCFGVDYSKGQIKIVNEKGFKGVVGSMVSIPFENDEFDVLISIAAHHHLLEFEDQLKALKEMKRILKKNCKILLVNWHPNKEYFEKEIEKGKFEKVKDKIYKVKFDKQVNRYYYFFEIGELSKMCINAGFEIEKEFIFENNIYVEMRKL